MVNDEVSPNVPPPHVALQRLTEEEAQEQERLARAASVKGASIWNQPGAVQSPARRILCRRQSDVPGTRAHSLWMPDMAQQ